MVKVQLIRPPMTEKYTVKQLGENVFYPVGLCVLAKSLKTKLGDNVEVEIIDGYGKTLDYVLSKLDKNADFVGTTSMYSNYDNALVVLETAKLYGAKTIIGGPNVHPIADRIIKNKKFVDYAVVNDGEDALPELVSGTDLNKIVNLVYRGQNGEAVKTVAKKAVLNTIFNLDDIVDRDDEKYKNHSVPISSIRGCVKAVKMGPCDFCSLPSRFSLMKPELVWEQIGLIYDKYGYDFFWETGDDAIVGNYLEKLLEARPERLSHIKFKFYVCPDQIDDKSAQTLRALNTKEVQIGVETPNYDVLKAVNKNHDLPKINRAVESLAKYGVDVHMAIMYGLTGDTIESANRTYDFAKHLVDTYQNIKKITTSHAIPFPGTAMFNRLASNPNIAAEYTAGDINTVESFDYTALTRLYCKHFTKVDYDDMEALVQKTRKLMDGRGDGTSFLLF